MDSKSFFYPDNDNSTAMRSAMPVISGNMLYKIFMELPAMLCVLGGPEFKVMLANSPFYKLIGNKEATGKKLIEILPEMGEQGFMEILNRVYYTGESYNGTEIPLKINRGEGRIETVYLNFNCQVFFDSEEKIRGILVFAYNVTERVTSRIKVEEAEESYRSLVDGLPTALYTCDAEGHINLYNDAAVRLWGKKPETGNASHDNLKLFDTKGKPLPVDKSPMKIALKSGTIINNEIIVEKPNGSRRNVIPYPQLIYDKDGVIKGSVNIFIDITEQVNARKELEQIGEMVRNLYMKAPAFICTLVGADHTFEMINPEYQKLYGKRKLEGRKFLDALPEMEGQGIIEKLDKVYETGEPVVVTERLVFIARDENLEPEATYLNFSYQPMQGPDNSINGILVFGYEVTDQVLARKKDEENLKTILESLPQITSTSGADGTNIYFNKFFFDYSGVSVEEAAKNGWDSILHPDEMEDVMTEWENCKVTSRDFYKEIRLRRDSDGMYRWHIAHLTPVKNNRDEVIQWVATATDIHEQKSKEQKKDDFLSIASHELKTPLTSVKAYLQLLEISLEDANEEVKLYTQKAILSVDRLKDLISELLDANKIQHGLLNLNIKKFDFDAMINNAIDAIQSYSQKHKIFSSVKVPGLIEGDQERLQQVVINLLSNAIKYSPDEGPVHLNAVVENEHIKVSVKDTGIGIDKLNLEKIFERYFRVASHDIRFQGLGIGLYISMNIIQQHQGKLWAESKLNHGSTFHFTIPMLQAQPY